MRNPVTLLLFVLASASSLTALAGGKVHPSPDGALRAVVIPVGKEGFEEQESRVEIRDARGRILRWRSFASADGEHGRGVNHAGWTADGQFFVFNAYSSGGHQPWNLATFFYSRKENRFYRLDDFVGPVTSDFRLEGRSTLSTTRFNFGSKDEREPVRVRLRNLPKRPR